MAVGVFNRKSTGGSRFAALAVIANRSKQSYCFSIVRNARFTMYLV